MDSGLRSLARAFGIEPGEGRVFLWGSATVFLIGWAAVSLANVSETLFLKRIGVDYVPFVFLVNSVLLVGTTYAVGRVAARAERRVLLVRTFFVLAGLLVPLWLLVRADVRSVFVLLVIAAKQLDAIALIVFWVALGGLLHGRQAKRLYAPIMAGGTLGSIVGSFASGPIGRTAGIPALLLVAGAGFALAGVVALKLRSTRHVRLHRAPGRATPAPAEAAVSLRPLWRESRLFQVLVVSALLSGVLGPMLYFQFLYVADLSTRGANGEQRLLDLYGAFRGWLNMGVLGIQLLGTSRLFRRMGVPLASTLSPLVYFFGFFGLGVRLDLPAGIGAVAGANLQDHAIYEPAQKMLATLFPEPVRSAAMASIEGPVRRFGGALGNLLIIGALALGARGWIGFAGLPIAALWLAVTVVLWRIYPTLLLELATDRRVDAGPALPELVDPRTLRMLTRRLIGSDVEHCRAACELVAGAPRSRAVQTLARALRHAPEENRTLLIATLHRVLDGGADTGRPLAGAASEVGTLLAAPGALRPLDRARLVDVYACVAADLGPGSPGAGVLGALATDPAESVRLAAAVRLQQASRSPAADGTTDAVLVAALASDDGCLREIAIGELRALLLAPDSRGAARVDARLALLAERLDHPPDRARVAETLADVAARRGARLAPLAGHLLRHMADPDPRVRAAVLRFVGHARLGAHAPWVVERLAAADHREAAAAREALGALGAEAMAALVAALRTGPRATRTAALARLREIPVDAATLRGLADGEVKSIRLGLVRLHGLGTGAVSDIVLQRLRERVDEHAHTTLQLLAALHHEDRLANLGHLLMRSGGGRARALLLEALESLLPPAEKARLMPLLDDNASAAVTAAAALERDLPSFDDALRETLAGQDALALTFLVATLDRDTLARVGGPLAAVPARGLATPGDSGDDADSLMLNRVEIVLHLRSLDLFAALTTRQLSELANVVHEEQHRAGATIVREGEFGDCMYVIDAGQVEITADGQLLAQLGPREYFGEMSLFDGETRSATVTATRRVRLLRLERQALFQVIEDHPGLAIGICQTLSRRVRNVIDKLEKAGKSEKPDV